VLEFSLIKLKIYGVQIKTNVNFFMYHKNKISAKK